MSHLFDSISLGGLTLPNRLMVSPMCQYSAINGNATDWHTAHLASLALGGIGLLCLEATAVSPEGRITPQCLGLWNDENETALAKTIQSVRAVSNTKLAIQLGHAGRKASSATPWDGGQLIAEANGGWTPIAPSAIPHKADEPAPAAMSKNDLERVKQAFIDASVRAIRLGFDAIELHAAHGYLLHEFLSPLANQRTDEYGGSLENRMRFPLEIIEAVRNIVPRTMALGVRVSATDWVDDEDSWTLDQTIIFSQNLKKLGIDWIDVSSAGISPKQKIPVGPGYQVKLAEAIKRDVPGLTTMAVGLITTPTQAQQIIEDNQADMIALGRSVLYNPRWAWHAAVELDKQVEGPPQYWRSLPPGTNSVFGDITFGVR